MNMMTKIKAIHSRLREAGYERQKKAWIVGPKIYKTYNSFESMRIGVTIPGKWSNPLRIQYQHELMELFDDMSPDFAIGFTGIVIPLDKPTEKE